MLPSHLSLRRIVLAAAFVGGFALVAPGIARDGPPDPIMVFLNQFVAACPTADPADMAALDRCRAALARTSEADAAFAAAGVVWGGEGAGKPLKELTLTHFDPAVFVRLYLSLYMAEGPPRMIYDSERKLEAVDQPVRFRNLLAQGEYPYPFWHSTAKWDSYQQSNMLRLYISRDDGRVAYVLRTMASDGAKPVIALKEAPSFDGHWMWEDRGTVEPRVTLFGAQFQAANAYLAEVDRSYRAFATLARQGTCLSCHVPNNPNGAKRLVLLQTPVHAAGEIRRVLKEVADGKMPIEDWGSPKPLDPVFKSLFLDRGTAFAEALDKARAWEAAHPLP